MSLKDLPNMTAQQVFDFVLTQMKLEALGDNVLEQHPVLPGAQS